MGAFRNAPVVTAGCWCLSVLIMAANVYLVLQQFNNMRGVWTAGTVVAVALGMLASGGAASRATAALRA